MPISNTSRYLKTYNWTPACQDLVTQAIKEIASDYDLSKRIFDKTGTSDPAIVNMINNSTIIFICIKYETFTSDLMNAVTHRRVAYNRPWSYTRFFASRFNLNIKEEYAKAHDAWGYYNTLKHINSHSRLENLDFNKAYKITSSWDALRFVYEAITALLKRLLEIPLR